MAVTAEMVQNAIDLETRVQAKYTSINPNRYFELNPIYSVVQMVSRARMAALKQVLNDLAPPTA